jgi:antitoxin (DNA-binding transcriptional repressor) of toxin-antitoxin stability system
MKGGTVMNSERTVAIADLKAHLSAELRHVRRAGSIIVLDHKKPVARLTRIEDGPAYTSRSSKPFVWSELTPLFSVDIQALIDGERADAW